MTVPEHLLRNFYSYLYMWRLDCFSSNWNLVLSSCYNILYIYKLLDITRVTVKKIASILKTPFCAITAKNFMKVKLRKTSTYNIRKKVEDSQAEHILTWDSRAIAERSLSSRQGEWHLVLHGQFQDRFSIIIWSFLRQTTYRWLKKVLFHQITVF